MWPQFGTTPGRSPIEIETGIKPSSPLDITDEVLAMQRRNPDLNEHLSDLFLLWAEVQESPRRFDHISQNVPKFGPQLQRDDSTDVCARFHPPTIAVWGPIELV